LPEVFGIRPLLLIPIAVSIAILENEIMGLFFGSFIGLLMDIGYGHIIGFNVIIMGVLCYFIGVLCVNFIKMNIFTSIILTAASIFIAVTLRFLVFYVLKGVDGVLHSYTYYYIPIMIYTFAFTPIAYYLNKSFVLWVRERY
jgi:rod shape-determining protein MreD